MFERPVPAAVLTGVLLAALVLVACNGEESTAVAPTPSPTATPLVEQTPTPGVVPSPAPTPSPTPAPGTIDLDERGLPAGAEGPLLVYATSDGAVSAGTHRVFIHDAGQQERAGWFELDGVLHVAGREILAVSEDAVAAHRLDGTVDRIIVDADEGERLSRVSVSPDGTLLALAEGGGIPPHTIEVIDVGTGQLVIDLDVDSVAVEAGIGSGDWPRGEFGWPVPCCWSADSDRLFLGGVVESTAPGTLRVLGLDGDVHSYGLSAFGMVDPGGNRFAFGEGPPLRYGRPPHDNLRVLDLQDGGEITIAQSDELGFQAGEWAPDGSALLYEVLEPAARPDAPDTEEWEVRELRLYDVASGEDREAPPLREVRSEWYGERAIVFECEDGQEPETRWSPPFDDAAPRMLASCRDGAATILAGGEHVDELHDPRILGWVEVGD